MGKPGAILLIGIGTFVLVMGWTGKLSAVWEVMRGGVDLNPLPAELPNPGDILPPQPTPPKPQPTDTEAPTGTNTCAPGRQMVVFRNDETNKRCILTADIAGTGQNGGCDARYLEVIRVTDGLKMCVKKLRGAGAVANDLGWMPRPNGTMARRYQPNVRAW